MIINYRGKYTEFKLFFLKYLLKIMHIFHQEINIYFVPQIRVVFAPHPPPKGGLIHSHNQFSLIERSLRAWRRRARQSSNPILKLKHHFSPPLGGQGGKNDMDLVAEINVNFLLKNVHYF